MRNKKTPRRTIRRSALAASLAVATAPLAVAHAHDDAGIGRLTGPQTQVIRTATQAFRDVNTALASGYVATDECVALPGEGAMGYHFVNPALASDMNVDPTLPEVLLYERDARGRWRLLGVEYFKADADQDLGTTADRPTLFGHAFDGPMPGHDPQMPAHYDLHVWVFKHNPSGQLAAWNPDVACP